MFKETPEGQTHSFNDGCGMPEHNNPEERCKHDVAGFECYECYPASPIVNKPKINGKPEPKGWEERWELIKAQSAPFTATSQYKNADFELIKSFIKSVEQEALERGRKEEREKVVRDVDRYLASEAATHGCTRCWSDDLQSVCTCNSERAEIINIKDKITYFIINSLNGNE